MPLNDKFVPYRDWGHVPLVIRWDGHVEAGAVDGRFAMNVDVPITIAEAAGVSVPGTAGLSLLGATARKRHTDHGSRVRRLER